MFVACFILCSPVLSQDYTDRPIVWQDNNAIGHIYMETTLEDCEYCYTLDTLNILGQQVIIRLDVSLVGYYDGFNMFSHDVKIYEEINLSKKEFLLRFSSINSGNMFELYFRKNKKGILYMHRKQWFYSNSFTYMEIADNDYTSFSSTHICNKVINKEVENTINFSDLFFLEQSDDTPENCFNCPIEYSWEECLKMKAKNKFIKIMKAHEKTEEFKNMD